MANEKVTKRVIFAQVRAAMSEALAKWSSEHVDKDLSDSMLMNYMQACERLKPTSESAATKILNEELAKYAREDKQPGQETKS